VVARLRADGQDVTWDGDFPGFRRVYAHDPFGNRLEFLQPASPRPARLHRFSASPDALLRPSPRDHAAATTTGLTSVVPTP